MRLDDLRACSRARSRPRRLREAGLIARDKGPAKVLANGELSTPVTVRGVKVSAGAREKIVAAGGRVEE